MAYANIGNNMPRLSRYGELFNDHAFQCMVAYLFEDILEFHRNAYSMLKKPGTGKPKFVQFIQNF